MTGVPWRKFIFLLVQLFFILKFFSWWQGKTHLGLGAYLILIFVLFWLFTWFFSKLEMGPSISRVIHYKVFSKFTFTQDWFGFLVVIATCLGFFFSRAVMDSAFMTYGAVIIGLVLAFYFYSLKLENKLIGLLAIAFVFGIGLGSRFTSNWVIIALFIVMNIFLYFLADVGS
jgi:hypothetical protein